MNTLKNTIANFRKSKMILGFNILGLSISFAVFIALGIYLYNEYTFDMYHKHTDQIYLLEYEQISGGSGSHPYLPNPLGELLEQSIPEISSHCSMWFKSGVFSAPDIPEVYHKLNLAMCDSTLTQIFTFNIIRGSQTPIQGNDAIFLSAKAAKRLFGNENPVGKTLLYNFERTVVVSAVYEELPGNSSLHSLDGFCSMSSIDWRHDWSEWSVPAFYEITGNVDIAAIETKINDLEKVKEICYDASGEKVATMALKPLRKLHFESGIGKGNKSLVNTLLSVSILLVIMAFVNFLNFSLANLPRTVKALSIRKVSGATKQSIYLQNFIDTAVLISLSFFISIGLLFILFRLKPDLYGYSISLNDQFELILCIYFALLFLGIFLSIFPLRILMKIDPIAALKGLVPFLNSGKAKHVFPVLQYSLAILLIITVFFINKQVHFVKNYKLGFEKENILVVNTSSAIQKHEKTFADELLKKPEILDYAYSQFVPGGVHMGWRRVVEGKTINLKAWPVDERYLSFMNFEILEGRPFSTNMEADENNFILNQAAVEAFDWQGQVLGKEIEGLREKGKVVGVVKDMKYASLYEGVQAMCFWLTPTRHNKLSLKISGENISETIAYIEKVYQSYESNVPFDYTFLDESLDAQYRKSEHQAQFITFACLVALLIAIIGSLGMIIFTTEYRSKEISIRKINGASCLEILQLLNKSYVWQVLIAFLIASPISYYAMSRWLEGFAYRTELSWWIFALAGLIALAVALLTVSWQSWRAATRNPVEALRYE